MTIRITADNLSMRFNDRVLFHIPYLTLGPKESVYLRGANGVGKTTLLRILSGLQKPTTGQLNLNQPHWSARLLGYSGNRQIVYLHQNPFLFDGSVYANVIYGMKYSHYNKLEKRKIVINALRLVGLETFIDEHISILSGGEKQRVAMARAWVLKPSILLMDEPSASIDEKSIKLLVVMVKDLLERGASIVVTSHQTNELTEICHRTWTISDAKLIESTPLKVIVSKDNYASAKSN